MESRAEKLAGKEARRRKRAKSRYSLAQISASILGSIHCVHLLVRGGGTDLFCLLVEQV
jgi:hypothetical protein